jgi:sec-independent protein translocase protein TatA
MAVSNILAIGMPAGYEWLVILVIALLIFGKRLPDIAKSVGRSMSEFKKGVEEGKSVKDEFTNEVKKLKDDVMNDSGINSNGTKV